MSRNNRREKKDSEALDPELQREILSEEDKASHESGTSNESAPEESREAGREGGRNRGRGENRDN